MQPQSAFRQDTLHPGDNGDVTDCDADLDVGSSTESSDTDGGRQGCPGGVASTKR